MKFKLHAGGVVDTLTKEELAAGLDQQTANWYKEAARGLSTARFDSNGTPATGNLQLPPVGGEALGPDVGFVWAVQRITADGLSAADVLNVYRNSVTPSNRVGEITQARGVRRSDGILLRGDERLIFTGTALTATGDVTINGDAFEAAESDLYKLV